MTDYASLGVRRVINCDARLTALGGSLMPEVVVDAMRSATDAFVGILELQDAVGAELARLTMNEAAYVCSSAPAGLALATLACRTGVDLTQIAGLPDSPPKKEVVIHNAHRIPYDPAIRLVGGRLVGISNMLQTFPWELEAAVNENTAAVLFVPDRISPRARYRWTTRLRSPTPLACRSSSTRPHNYHPQRTTGDSRPARAPILPCSGAARRSGAPSHQGSSSVVPTSSGRAPPTGRRTSDSPAQ